MRVVGGFLAQRTLGKFPASKVRRCLTHSLSISGRQAPQARVRDTDPAHWELTFGGLCPACPCSRCLWVIRKHPISLWTSIFPICQTECSDELRIYPARRSTGDLGLRAENPHWLCGPSQVPHLSEAQGPHLRHGQVTRLARAVRVKGQHGRSGAARCPLPSTWPTQHPSFPPATLFPEMGLPPGAQ